MGGGVTELGVGGREAQKGGGRDCQQGLDWSIGARGGSGLGFAPSWGEPPKPSPKEGVGQLAWRGHPSWILGDIGAPLRDA